MQPKRFSVMVTLLMQSHIDAVNVTDGRSAAQSVILCKAVGWFKLYVLPGV